MPEAQLVDSLLGEATQSTQVFIRRLAGAEPLCLNVQADSTVAQLKSLIQGTLGIEPRKQKLVHELTVIEGDGKTLQDFGLEEGAVLTMVVVQLPQLGDLARCEWWCQMRDRIVTKRPRVN